jgi:hypothetical protein
MIPAEARAESENIDNVIKTYWHELACRGGPSSPSSRRSRRPAPFIPIASKEPQPEETASAGLRQNLATAQAAAAKAAEDVTALRAQVTQLEAQLAGQSRTETLAQETLQAARWDWLGRGFIGGCVITTGLLGAFVLYFTL